MDKNPVIIMTDSQEEKDSLDKIIASVLFMTMAESGWLQDVQDKNGIEYKQVQMATQLKKPALIMMDKHLTEEQKEYVRELHRGCPDVREIEVDFKTDDYSGTEILLKAMIEEYGNE